MSADGIVYFGSGDEHVYALRLIDGSKVWSRQLDNSVNQVVVCGDYLLAERSSLEVLTRESGRGVSVLFDSPDDFVVGGIRVAGSDAYFATYETFVALDCSA